MRMSTSCSQLRPRKAHTMKTRPTRGKAAELFDLLDADPVQPVRSTADNIANYAGAADVPLHTARTVIYWHRRLRSGAKRRKA